MGRGRPGEPGTSDDDGGGADLDDKALQRRLKNREAAKRVRERRVNAIKTLSDQVDILVADNERLRNALSVIAEGGKLNVPFDELLQPPPDLPTEAMEVINKIRLTDDKETGRHPSHTAPPAAGGGPSTSSQHSGGTLTCSKPTKNTGVQTDASLEAKQRPTDLIHTLMAALQQQHRDLAATPGAVPASTMEQLQAMMELQLCVQQSMAALMAQQQQAMQQQAMLAAAGQLPAVGGGLMPNQESKQAVAAVAQQQQQQQQQQQAAMQQQAAVLQQQQQAAAMMQLAGMGGVMAQQTAGAQGQALAWQQAQAQARMQQWQQQQQQMQQMQQQAFSGAQQALAAGWGGPPAARGVAIKVETPDGSSGSGSGAQGIKNAPAGPLSGSDQPAAKRSVAPAAAPPAARVAAPAAAVAAPRGAPPAAPVSLEAVPEAMQLQSARSLGSILNQLEGLDEAVLMSTDLGMPTSDLNVRTSDLQIASEEILRHVPTPEEATASRSTAWL